MQIERSEQDNVISLHLNGDLTIYSAPESKDLLLAAIEDGLELEIDLSGVSEMDTAGFQVLLLIKREATRAGKGLRLVCHSPAVQDVLETYSMSQYFGDPVLISSRQA